MSEALIKPGSVEEALRNGRKLLQTRPDAALAQAHAILRRDANNSDALRLAASAHRLRGESKEAEQAELTAIKNSDSDLVLNKVVVDLSAGRLSDAAQAINEYLERHPEDLAAMTIAAEALLAQKRFEDSEALLRKVLARAPNFAAAERLLVDGLVKQTKFMAARDVLEARVSQGERGLFRTLAKVQAEGNDLEAAASSFEKALEADDRQPITWVDYAGVLRFLGRKVESRLAYQRALSVNRYHGQAWWGLVNLDPAAIDDEQLESLRAGVEASADSPEQLANLHFAVAQVLDSRGDYANAFQSFSRGNAVWKRLHPHDPDKLTRYVDQSIDLLADNAFGLSKPSFVFEPGPIFVIGMPRSGSTLVDRILGQHSACENVGELQIVMRIATSLRSGDKSTSFPEQVARLSARKVRDLAQQYLDRAAEVRHTDKLYYTDKMHMNWRQLPLILRMFPQAPIIDVRRSAMDCCWSNYKLLFARGHTAASDQEWLGRCYRDYARLLDEVHRLAPGRVLRVDYEHFVDDPEAGTRRILSYLGLSYEPGMLEFHRSEAPVATASSEQVRRPINRDGIGAWKPYEQWLAPLRSALGPFADEE